MKAALAAGLLLLSCGRPAAPAPFSPWREPSTGMGFVYLPPGRFRMGSPENEPGRREDETPHEVRLTRGFWIGSREVSQGEWDLVMGPGEPHPDKPSPFRAGDPRCPVLSVSYFDIQRFLARLAARSPGSRFRLPTEAEWEYACRAGTDSAFASGRALGAAQADIEAPGAPGRPLPAGSYAPNAWGLFDMHGNAWEWTSDWYGPYAPGPATDPQGPASGTLKVIRGGSWAFDAANARSASRYTHPPQEWGYSLGFRVVRVKESDP